MIDESRELRERGGEEGELIYHAVAYERGFAFSPVIDYRGGVHVYERGLMHCEPRPRIGAYVI